MFGLDWRRNQPATGAPTGLPSRTVAEVLYRFALTPALAFTPDFQFILNPSLDPRRDTLAVFSLPARLAF